MTIEAARSLWDPKTIYLNTASYGLPPRPAWDAVQNALDEWRGGCTGFLGWDESVGGARSTWARIVNTGEDDVCVGSTVAGLAAFVAASLPDGSRVLAPDVEFTSNLWPWMIHSDRGVSITTVPAHRIVDAIDDSIDLIAVSAVQSATGEVMDLAAINDAAKRCGAQVFLDATQACGWLPLDASQWDYLACAAYKWLMSPRGTAFMSVKAERLEHVRPIAANWYAGENVHDSYYGLPLRLASTARRLDVSPAWFPWVGTLPALETVDSIGVARIHEHNVSLANLFLRGLGLPEGDSAIVSIDRADGLERFQRAGIMAAARAGQLRVAFHIYNTASDVDAALEALT
jgi:selenocysteine lyase/cysteine desulfurase